MFDINKRKLQIEYGFSEMEAKLIIYQSFITMLNNIQFDIHIVRSDKKFESIMGLLNEYNQLLIG